MNNDQERTDSEQVPPMAPATGVATGNLGTASNLEDTQVFRIADLAGEEPVDIVPPPEPISTAAPVSSAAAIDAVPATPAAPAAPPAPVARVAPVAPVQEVAATRPRRRGITGPSIPFRRQPVARTAGLAAAAAVLVLGAFVILSSAGRLAGGPGQAGSTNAGAAATVAPTAETGGDKGDGKGDGNGKGNGKGGGKND